MARKVLVIGEVRDGELRNVSLEAIAAGKTISEGGEVVATIFSDSDLDNAAQQLIHGGADKVVIVQNENLKNYTSEGFAQAALAVIEQENPEGIVMGHTAQGKDLTPKLASKLDSGLISDVTDIEVAGGNIVFERPIYSGKAFEKKIVTDVSFLQRSVLTTFQL